MRDEEVKVKFMQYLLEHPGQRFWQAVRNFSPFAKIMGGGKDLKDTFYLEGEEAVNPDVWVELA